MPSDIAVLVGRFQPFHDAHLALLERGLACASRCVVVIGSAFQARTPRNPFTCKERPEMVRQALPEGDRKRPEVRADDDAASVRWLPIADLAAMEDRFFDDHFHMLDHFIGLARRPA
jgi:bifunctional NMN adenylyltransferase/nudix hydrolase